MTGPDPSPHPPSGEHLLAHLRNHYGVDAVAATPVRRHNDHVFRIDRDDGPPWIARAYPSSRPRHRVDGDAAILRVLERNGYPAERPAVDDAVSVLDGGPILVTGCIDGGPLPDGGEKMAMMGDLLGRLHALPVDAASDRRGGAAGDEPGREGGPDQDLMAAWSLLDTVDAVIGHEARDRFERLRSQVRSADAGEGLPEALVHGNLLHDPDHALLTAAGPVAINWRTAGRGPRLADLAYLLWGAEWGDGNGVAVAVGAYRRHIEPTDDELDRLEAVMYLRPLYLACVDLRRTVEGGRQPTGDEWWWGLIDPDHIAANAEAARAAFRA
ncbi:MAG: hypothetical protein AAGD35_13100 [Actinomycetota bacterium]